MPETIFSFIVAFVVIGFAVERLLSYLNSTRFSEVLPEELIGIYDAEEYRRSQQYLKAKQKFGLFTDSISFIGVMILLLFGGFAMLDQAVSTITENSIWKALLFFGILGIASDVLSTPFELYYMFVIEERFGFNKTTFKTFFLDKLKGWLLVALIGGGLLTAVIWIYQSSGQWFWLIAWGVITLFSILITMFYSNIIVPIFNKQRPLEEGELRAAIEDFARKVGFNLKDIYVIDGSKRSTKANAYFAGLGPKKRIVLYDTLIENHAVDELVAVLAHEIGHYKKKHTLTGMLLGIVQTGVLLYILQLFIGNPLLSQALGAELGSFHMGVLAFGLLYSPISMLLGIIMNLISRKNEFAADRFAALNYNKTSMKEALKKLSVKNLSNLRPHPAMVFVSYSHPPLLQRLAAIDKAC